MSTFQPLGCGFGRPILPLATPADTPDSETATMAKKTHPIAEAILRVIGEAGGTLAAADLGDKLPDVADANRRYHLHKLVSDGHLTAAGKTSDRTYTIADPGTAPPAGHRMANVAKAKAKKAAKGKTTASKPAATQPFDQFDHAEREANAVLAGDTQLMPRPAPGLNIAVAIVRPTLEAQQSVAIEAAFLRRVLRLALSAPGDICDADRQALHAIASAA